MTSPDELARERDVEALHVDLHGLVAIELNARRLVLGDFRTAFKDVIECAVGSPDEPRAAGRPTLRLIHSADLAVDGGRDRGDGLVGGHGAAVDREYGVRFSRPEPGVIELRSSGGAMEWLIWSVQLLLLEADATFVHCAGVARGGAALLFPSWGGVGKTAIAKSLVADRGWKLLGDDLVIVSAAGSCRAFPKGMVLYPYHRAVFPELFAAGQGPVAPVGLTTTLTAMAIRVKPLLRQVPGLLAMARRHNPQSSLVPPSRAFGAGAIALGTSRLDRVVWIDRDPTVTRATVRRADGELASRIAGSTLSEFDRRCVGLTPILCGLGILDFQRIYPAWDRVIRSALAGAEEWMVMIPATLPVADVPAELHRALASVGIETA